MPFKTIWALTLCFNSYLPAGSYDCNGDISTVSPRRIEESGKSVLDFLLFWVTSQNTYTCLALRSCPRLLLESKSALSLYHSTSPSFLVSQFLLPQFTCCDPARRAVHVFTLHFPSVFLCLIKYKSSGPERTHLFF